VKLHIIILLCTFEKYLEYNVRNIMCYDDKVQFVKRERRLDRFKTRRLYYVIFNEE